MILGWISHLCLLVQGTKGEGMSLLSHAGRVSGASVPATLPLPLLESRLAKTPGKGRPGP